MVFSDTKRTQGSRLASAFNRLAPEIMDMFANAAPASPPQHASFPAGSSAPSVAYPSPEVETNLGPSDRPGVDMSPGVTFHTFSAQIPFMAAPKSAPAPLSHHEEGFMPIIEHPNEGEKDADEDDSGEDEDEDVDEDEDEDLDDEEDEDVDEDVDEDEDEEDEDEDEDVDEDIHEDIDVDIDLGIDEADGYGTDSWYSDEVHMTDSEEYDEDTMDWTVLVPECGDIIMGNTSLPSALGKRRRSEEYDDSDELRGPVVTPTKKFRSESSTAVPVHDGILIVLPPILPPPRPRRKSRVPMTRCRFLRLMEERATAWGIKLWVPRLIPRIVPPWFSLYIPRFCH